LRHYEIVLMVHPDQSEQVPGMLDRYKTVVESNNGTVHRQEDWGRLQLAYTIDKLHKAHYLMINIECDSETLAELEGIFRFNDAILRHLTVKQDKAYTEPSVMMRKKEDKDERKDERKDKERSRASHSNDSEDESGNDEPEDSDVEDTGTEDADTDDEVSEETETATTEKEEA